jgi:tetratricopeptide (TPR) repeat protein
LSLAERARDLAAGIDAETVGNVHWAALQAEAWAVLGSTFRAVGDLARAENALNIALYFLDSTRPVADPAASARWAQRAAYLRSDQRRSAEALDLIATAIDELEQLGDSARLSCAWVDRGVILHRAGRTRDAISCLRRAFEKLEREREPRVYLAATHNMALYLQEVAEGPAELAEALRWLEQAIQEHARLPERISLLKLRVLAALTAIRLGQRETGTAELWRAFEGFRALDSTLNQAVVLLHLIGLALAAGDLSETQRLAGLLFPLFSRLAVDEPSSRALKAFLRAAQTQSLTVDAVEALTRQLTGGKS